MPVVKQCFCCSLRTAVTVFGWLGMIFQLLKITACSVILTNKDALFTNESQIKGISIGVPVALTIEVICLISFILMTCGAVYANRFLLLPWLVMGMFSIVVNFALLVTCVIGLVVAIYLSVFLAAFIVSTIFFAVQIYLWLVVFSLFQDMRDNGQSVITEHLVENDSSRIYSKLQETNEF